MSFRKSWVYFAASAHEGITFGLRRASLFRDDESVGEIVQWVLPAISLATGPCRTDHNQYRDRPDQEHRDTENHRQGQPLALLPSHSW